MACCPGKRLSEREETGEEPYSRGSVRGEARRLFGRQLDLSVFEALERVCGD